jgi:hypothetical protein
MKMERNTIDGLYFRGYRANITVPTFGAGVSVGLKDLYLGVACAMVKAKVVAVYEKT